MLQKQEKITTTRGSKLGGETEPALVDPTKNRISLSIFLSLSVRMKTMRGDAEEWMTVETYPVTATPSHWSLLWIFWMAAMSHCTESQSRCFKGLDRTGRCGFQVEQTPEQTLWQQRTKATGTTEGWLLPCPSGAYEVQGIACKGAETPPGSLSHSWSSDMFPPPLSPISGIKENVAPTEKKLGTLLSYQANTGLSLNPMGERQKTRNPPLPKEEDDKVPTWSTPIREERKRAVPLWLKQEDKKIKNKGDNLGRKKIRRGKKELRQKRKKQPRSIYKAGNWEDRNRGKRPDSSGREAESEERSSRDMPWWRLCWEGQRSLGQWRRGKKTKETFADVLKIDKLKERKKK